LLFGANFRLRRLGGTKLNRKKGAVRGTAPTATARVGAAITVADCRIEAI
jgi:hypothetical protein